MPSVKLYVMLLAKDNGIKFACIELTKGTQNAKEHFDYLFFFYLMLKQPGLKSSVSRGLGTFGQSLRIMLSDLRKYFQNNQ